MRPEEGFAPADVDGAAGAARSKPRKAPNAFRTISEVADELHIPQHVLRFWETKFPQVRPLKRGGGRRYYRPDDISLLRRISDLLYIEGYTIKGVQRLLREGGGKLADDIPPPAPDERAEVEEAPLGTSEPQLPMPGLAPAPQGLPQLARAAARSAGGQLRGGGPGGTEPPERQLTAENAALRHLLAVALAALEEVRALLA